MSKKPSAAAAKRLSQANLEALGADRLAALLMELGDSQPNLKRRLRMELAAAVGAGDLAAEIDKRLTALATSKARVSWRKRADLVLDLHVLRRMIAERLGELDATGAFARLWVFLDLSEDLGLRVKDPKGELAPVFLEAAADIAILAESSPDAAMATAPQLADILLRARPTWAAWLQVALPPLGKPFSRAVLDAVNAARQARPALAPSGQVLRALADKAGDVDAFIETVSPRLLSDPATGAAIAIRLLADGRVDDAMAALRASDPTERGKAPAFGRLAPDAGEEAWHAAHIEVLQAQGRDSTAQAERWAAFERTLSPDMLRAHLKRLADFDDVIATDRATAIAAGHPRFAAGLAFLMEWPALTEAATMVEKRPGDVEGKPEDLVAWAARLEGRRPLAALLLYRQALLGLRTQRGDHDAVTHVLQEIEALTARIDDWKGVEGPEAFMARATGRRGYFR